MLQFNNEKELRAQLIELKERQGLTLRQIGKAIGISESAISQWLSDSYKGDVKKIDESIRQYLQRMQERIRRPRQQIPFIETSIVRKVFEIARICHIDGEIGVITGNSGIGKTWAVREYARRNNDVILIEVDDRCSGKVNFVRTLHRNMGFDGSGRIDQMLEYIIERLTDSGRLLIVDEAERLPYKTLELIRRLHDFTDIGVLLVGMPLLIENLRGRKRDYAQIYSRISVPCRLHDLKMKDTQEIVNAILPNVNGLANVFHEQCQSNIRILRTLILRSVKIAEINNCDLSPDLIKEVRKSLIA